MKKFLILLLALMLPLCASAAITVPDHVTEIGEEAFAGVNTDYLVIGICINKVTTQLPGIGHCCRLTSSMSVETGNTP